MDGDDDDVYFRNLLKAFLSFCVHVSQVRTCKPALGHSFAAGTTDGGGDLNFTQGISAPALIQMSVTDFDLTSEHLCLSLQELWLVTPSGIVSEMLSWESHPMRHKNVISPNQFCSALERYRLRRHVTYQLEQPLSRK